MRCLIKGLSAPADVLKLYKAADAADVPVRVMGSDGTPTTITAVTVTVEVYDTISRKNAAIKSFACTTVVATGGEAKFVASVASVNFGPGVYYAFVKTVTAGAIAFSDNYITVKIG